MHGLLANIDLTILTFTNAPPVQFLVTVLSLNSLSLKTRFMITGLMKHHIG